MRRFYHPSDLYADERIRRTLQRHGATAYAVVMHVVELAVASLSRSNLSPLVAHDASAIADTLNVRGEDPPAIVQSILNSMAMEGLIEISLDGDMTCPFALQFLDSSLTSVPELRSMLAGESAQKENPMQEVDLFGEPIDLPKEKQNPRLTADGRPRPTAEWVKETYNDICTKLPAVRAMSSKRVNRIRALTTSFGEKEIIEVFTIAQSSRFLRGEKGKWKASFDWLMNANNFVKVLEGNYTDASDVHINDKFEGLRSGDLSDEVFGRKVGE